MSALLAHDLIKLKLHDEARKIANVGHVGSNMILGTGVEIQQPSLYRWHDALHRFPHLPPSAVIILGGSGPVENSPSPSIDEQTEWEESNFVECHVHEIVDFRLCNKEDFGIQSEHKRKLDDDRDCKFNFNFCFQKPKLLRSKPQKRVQKLVLSNFRNF